MKNFVIVIPRAEIQPFEQALTDTIEGCRYTVYPCGLQKYSVTVSYPDYTEPKKFVDLGTRFNELLKSEPF